MINATKEPLANAREEHHDTATPAQRQRLLAALKVAPVTTIEARERLAIMHAAARTQELRRAGYNIITQKTREQDASGTMHLVARYVLIEAKEVAI